MAHQFSYSGETDTDHVFTCSVCGIPVQFNKPGIGNPNAVVDGEAVEPPDDVETYVTPCTGEQA